MVSGGQQGIRNAEVVLGLCPSDRKILLGSHPQRGFQGGDGFLQIRGTVSSGQRGIRNAEVVLGRCPFFLIGSLIGFCCLFIESDRFLQVGRNGFLTSTQRVI